MSLREAAERMLKAEFLDRPGDFMAGVNDAMAARRLADAFSDPAPITEEWLVEIFGPHLPSCGYKRYSLALVKRGPVELNWCPPCGKLPHCLCAGEFVLVTEPSRGALMRLVSGLRGE